VELLRLLAVHPAVEVSVITSRTEAGLRVDELFPNLRGVVDLVFREPDIDTLARCDLVFFATPHGVAMEMMDDLLGTGTRVVDLSADFRLRDQAVWEQWYQVEHTSPELLEEAVYGLPEVNRELIAGARLVAAPGCYPTAIQLGFLPLLEAGIVDTGRLIANAASGVSGAGRQARLDNLLSEVSDSFKAYSAVGHRHLPEIEQGLTAVSGSHVQLTFVPHLLPMVRGIHATLYATLTSTGNEDLQALYEHRYQNEPFVDVLPFGSHPQTRSVRSSNMCRIALHRPQQRDTIVVLSVIDNLVKGASGQAIQNMNIMLGLDETEGLGGIALMP
jgi:N-acetyl-gamma-glutamyl-phosphate reductase